MNEIELLRRRKASMDSVLKLDLDLDDLTVFTEAASGNYLYTPVMAAQAGARVYAYAKDSKYGSAQAVGLRLKDECREMGIDDKVSVVYSRLKSAIQECDIITNAGLVRPIDVETIQAMNPKAVVSLMYDPAEFRPEDVDLAECRNRGILVLGTNEESPVLDIMRYGGFLATKLLFGEGLEVHLDNILVIGEGRLASNINHFFQATNVSSQLVKPSLSAFRTLRIQQFDAIVVADMSRGSQIIGPMGVLKPIEISQTNPAIQIAYICGEIDVADLEKHGIAVHPREVAKPGSMAVTLDCLGPKATMRLNAAGLKVGEIMARNRRVCPTLRDAYQASLAHPLVMDMQGGFLK